jgi:hypothetical protein
MTITAKELADGQLPNARGDLYTVPADTIAYIKSITLHNTDTSAHDVTITKEPTGAGTERVIIGATLDAGDTFYFDEPTVMDATDVLRGDDGGGGGNVVDYTVSGAEET